MDNKSVSYEFDYSDEKREDTINALYAYAKTERSFVECKWKTLDDIYRSFQNSIKKKRFLYDSASDELKVILKNNLESLTDSFIQVESQINPEYPNPMFKGRDNKEDSAKAKQREYIVKSVLYCNDIKSKNTKHERCVKKYGDGFYKVFYNADKQYYNEKKGAIDIEPINIDDLFVDPSASCVDDCEFIDHVYYMHRQKAKRVFKEDFKKHKITDELLYTEEKSITETVSNNDNNTNQYDVQIMEHWYKDEDGDIALSMLVNGKEFRHIKKYWEKTGLQNKLYPFVHFYSIKDDKGFYNISELEVISGLIDIENRFLNAGIKNMELMSNTVWTRQVRTNIAEKAKNSDSEEELEELTNQPGAVIEYGQGLERPQRAEGLNPLDKFISNIQFIQSQIQRTLRNFDSNNGMAIDRTTTASEVQQLKAYQDEQKNTKEYDRLQGWKRLFVLIDWTALEFYDDDRLVYMGVPQKVGNDIDIAGRTENLDPQQGDIFFTFNSDKLRKAINERVESLDAEGKNIYINDGYYYPTIDCEVTPTNAAESNAIINNLMQLAGIQMSVNNYKIIASAIEQLNIPQKQDIIDEIYNVYEPKPIEGVDPKIQALISKLPLETQAILRKRPDLIETALKSAQQGAKPQTVQGMVQTPVATQTPTTARTA